MWGIEGRRRELWDHYSVAIAYVVARLSQSTSRQMIYPADFNPYRKRQSGLPLVKGGDAERRLFDMAVVEG